MGIEVILLYQTLLESLAKDLNCEWELLAGQLMQESSGNPDAIGDDGHAWGLGQIWEVTMKNHRFADEWEPEDLLDADKNLQVYAAEMRRLGKWLKRYDVDDVRWVLASYNWGAGNVKKHLEAGKSWDEVPEQVKWYVELCVEKGEAI